jgi:hypothetical protein
LTDVHQQHLVVAIYASHAGAAAALTTVQRSGFDMSKWSLLGKDVLGQAHAFGFYSAGDYMKFWAGPNAVWSSVWLMLSGGGFFFIPAIGPIVVMGPLVDWIVDALATASVSGQGDVPSAALTRLGLADDNVAQCALAVNAGNFVVLAQGSAVLAERARLVLASTGASPLELAIRDAPEHVPLRA